MCVCHVLLKDLLTYLLRRNTSEMNEIYEGLSVNAGVPGAVMRE